MNIAGQQFRILRTRTFFNGPGIYVFIHQASGKCFVNTTRNCHLMRGKKNYPNALLELLKTNPSEVLIWVTEFNKDTLQSTIKETSSAIKSYFEKQDILYKKPKKNVLSNKVKAIRFTVWKIVHVSSGAIFYFENHKDIARELITAKVSQRMLTFNSYVMKNIVNSNRVMHYFAKSWYPLDVADWEFTDLEQEFATEKESSLYITKQTKEHLVRGEVVLSQVNGGDVLYYRNALLKLPHKGFMEYLSSVLKKKK